MNVLDWSLLICAFVGWFLAGMYKQRARTSARSNDTLREKVWRYKQLLNTQYGPIGERAYRPNEGRCDSTFEELRCQGAINHSGHVHGDVRGLAGPRDQQELVQWNNEGVRL